MSVLLSYFSLATGCFVCGCQFGEIPNLKKSSPVPCRDAGRHFDVFFQYFPMCEGKPSKAPNGLWNHASCCHQSNHSYYIDSVTKMESWFDDHEVKLQKQSVAIKCWLLKIDKISGHTKIMHNDIIQFECLGDFVGAWGLFTPPEGLELWNHALGVVEGILKDIKSTSKSLKIHISCWCPWTGHCSNLLKLEAAFLSWQVLPRLPNLQVPYPALR